MTFCEAWILDISQVKYINFLCLHVFFSPQMCFHFVFQTSSWHFLLPGITNIELERYFGKAQKSYNKHTIWPPNQNPTNFTKKSLREALALMATGSLLERHPGHIVTSIPWGSSVIFTYLTPQNTSRDFGKLSDSAFKPRCLQCDYRFQKQWLRQQARGADPPLLSESLTIEIFLQSLFFEEQEI